MTQLPTPRVKHWGEAAARSPIERLGGWFRSVVGPAPQSTAERLPDLPVALRRSPLADPYVAAARQADHRRAAVAASGASERAIEARAWWAADAWAHRALWHFERSDMTLAATREARRIGDIRTAAGDPASARRYYAEAISEARDIGAEREEGLAALGLGRAELALGSVTQSRRLASVAEDLLVRAEAAPEEVAAARALRGEEKVVSAPAREEG